LGLKRAPLIHWKASVIKDFERFYLIVAFIRIRCYYILHNNFTKRCWRR